MMSATIAHENYIATTTVNTAVIMASITDRANTMLAQIERLINQLSHEGRKELTLRFPIKHDAVKREAINSSSFYNCEWCGAHNAYCIHLFCNVREGYTNITLNEKDQRDLILDVLRVAGYEVQQLNNSNWVIKWA